MTGRVFSGQLLVPNHMLKSLIAQYFPEASRAQTVRQISAFYRLPIDIISLLFSCLDFISLATIMRVCKEWKDVSSDDRLWKTQVLGKFGSVDPFVLATCGNSMYQYFRRSYQNQVGGQVKDDRDFVKFGIRLVPMQRDESDDDEDNDHER